MKTSQEKQKRMAYIARRYYLEDQKQSDIARELGISRPLVSRILSEARELGGGGDHHSRPGGPRQPGCWSGCGRPAQSRAASWWRTERTTTPPISSLSKGAVELRAAVGHPGAWGVGWGYLIGQLVTWLEKHPQPDSPITDICPLVGNASIPARNYQSNENVRLMAQQLGATPHFLYLPALPESLEEKQLLCSTENLPAESTRSGSSWTRRWSIWGTTLQAPTSHPWSGMGICSNSSTPVGGCWCTITMRRYGDPVGTGFCHSDSDGNPENGAPRIIGVCSANTSVKALRGALQSGFLTHIVTRADLVKTLLHETVT